MKAPITKSLCYSNILGEIINACGFESYLELGIDTGYTTKQVLDKAPDLKQVYNVDLRGGEIVKFHSVHQEKVKYFLNITTDAFFDSKVVTNVDCVFVDADHSYQQSRKDFLNAYEILNDDGIIFLHDTYPPNLELTRPDRNGDTYKLYEELSSNDWKEKVDIINLPIYDGLTIIRKREAKKIFTL